MQARIPLMTTLLPSLGALCVLMCTRPAVTTPPDARVALDQVLEELKAGSDANTSRIAHGTASYVVQSEHRTEDHEEWDSSTLTADVWISGANTRWNTKDSKSGQHRLLATTEFDAMFNVTHLKAQRPRPAFHEVVILSAPTTMAIFSPYDFHPRYLGHSPKATRKGSSLSAFLDLLSKNSQEGTATVTAKPVGDAVQVTVDWDEHMVRQALWIAPHQGHSIVREEWWSLQHPARPTYESRAQYKEAIPGVWVASRIETIDRIPVEDEYVDYHRTTTTLDRIDLTVRPPDDLFTIDGLEPPTGARINDRRTGKTDLYGIPAATDDEIAAEIEQMSRDHLLGVADTPDTADSSGPRRAYAIITVAVVGLVGLCLLSIGLVHRVRRQRLT